MNNNDKVFVMIICIFMFILGCIVGSWNYEQTNDFREQSILTKLEKDKELLLERIIEYREDIFSCEEKYRKLVLNEELNEVNKNE
jgi:hypothetical protein